MTVLLVLLIASLFITVGFLVAFLWSVKAGQYDDMYSPTNRVLFPEHKKENSLKK